MQAYLRIKNWSPPPLKLNTFDLSLVFYKNSLIRKLRLKIPEGLRNFKKIFEADILWKVSNGMLVLVKTCQIK